MFIEFQCPNCHQTLRTPQDSAGKKARCPKCEYVTDVPAVAATPPEPMPEESWDQGDAWKDVDQFAAGGASNSAAPNKGQQLPSGFDPGAFKDSGGSHYSGPQANPYSAPTPESYNPFQSGPQRTAGVYMPTAIDIGGCINHAFEMWKQQLGIAIAVVLVANILSSVIFNIPYYAGQILIAAGAEEIGVIVMLGSLFIGIFFGTLMAIGQKRVMLQIARGQPAEFAELFSGVRYILPVIGATILFFLMVVGGSMLCVIPGILVMATFWPFFPLIVDDKAGVGESFSKAWEVGKINLGPTIVIYLLSVAFTILGYLACLVGLIFAMPLISLLWTTAYLMMIGELRTR